MTTNYIDNKTFYEAIKQYKNTVKEAEAANKEKPILPNYLGECILLIANRLATKPNFINYSYRDEMIADGIENCIMYIDNFDPDKSTNPFAYFTQIIYFAFLRRIQKEKKHLYIKHQVYKNSAISDELFELQDGDIFDGGPVNNMFENEKMSDFIKSFEDNLEKKRKPQEKIGIDKFVEE
jgi:DNA-directed RNA polymerase specialized sigma24 family protein